MLKRVFLFSYGRLLLVFLINFCERKKEVFIGADDHPMTYREMMDACLASGAFEGDVLFSGTSGSDQGRGKVVDSSASKRRLAWQNRYESFCSFMSKSGGPSDFYTACS
eukprot:TRINITY_DN106550_c0_g1_i1.p2 TRINITY_DN106550_c0_g1~~TRINITY_DN106550_c0_g1_i1.p2  ORF type:complete len:116 (-),score=7.30 TRINITY_DN106550_c0_g1_i1:36-362(-)